MSYVIVDVESDGPIPAEFSMVCWGAVVFDDLLDKTFYRRTRPVSDRFVPEALAVSGFSREQHLAFDDPKTVMVPFASWLKQNGAQLRNDRKSTWPIPMARRADSLNTPLGIGKRQQSKTSFSAPALTSRTNRTLIG